MTRRASVTVVQRNASVVSRIQALKTEYPFWGCRRIWAHVWFVDGLPINKKRVLRLVRAHELPVKTNVRLNATRTPQRSQPRPRIGCWRWSRTWPDSSRRGRRVRGCRS